MEKVKVNKTGNFSDTECIQKFKWWGITGKENPIMAGTYRCRTCEFHVFLPLAGKNTFGCSFKGDK